MSQIDPSYMIISTGRRGILRVQSQLLLLLQKLCFTNVYLSRRYLMIHRRYQLQTYGNKILSRNKDITNLYLTQTIIFTMTSLLTRMIRMKWVIKKIYVYDQPSSPLQPYIGVCIFFSSIANDCLKNLKNIVLFEATATFQLLSLRNIT